MNQGARELKAKIAELGLGQNEAARRVGADSGNFSKILAGKSLPGRKVSAAIVREFAVASDLFDKPLEAVPEPDATGTHGGDR